MRVFVTGATGFIGSAIVKELMAAGHKVLGLARSDAGAASLARAGADVHRGSLEDLESLKRGAADSDGVIHTAFIHDFSQYVANCETDRRAIAALSAGLAGSNRLLLVTSGTGMILTPGRSSTEDDRPAAGSAALPRLASEEAAAAATAQGVRVAVVRLPQVHDRNKHGLVTMAIAIAQQKGVSAYIGNGRNRWPAVHLLDTAPLYRLAFEKGAAGVTYHAVAEEGVALRDIAEAIGRRLNVPVVSKTPAEADEHFGWLARFAANDAPASSKLTQQRLGWRPKQQGMIADLDPA